MTSCLPLFPLRRWLHRRERQVFLPAVCVPLQGSRFLGKDVFQRHPSPARLLSARNQVPLQLLYTCFLETHLYHGGCCIPQYPNKIHVFILALSKKRKLLASFCVKGRILGFNIRLRVFFPAYFGETNIYFSEVDFTLSK